MDKSSKATNFEEFLGPARMINEAHEVVNKKAKERKKSLLYLIYQYLKDEGYNEAALALQEETQLSPHYCVCDNIDLGSIIQEYEAYYYLRYQKYPKLYRQQVMAKDSVGDSTRRKCKSAKANFSKRGRGRQIISISKEDLSEKSESLGSDLLTIQPIFPKDDAFQEALPLHISASSEMQELADIISREIVTTNLNVQWSDVIGLDHVKSVLRETVVYPSKYPGLFHGLLTPWKAVLLYGPPGTGKTLLAKAVASECKTTFFNISSSSIVSKWRGESEKLVKVLFELARHHAPSTIFIDELDAIACRSGSEDHEGSRRLRAELLIHLDGLASTSQDNVFLLATTNRPWDLDQSMLRRLEKRILVDVPNLQDREALIKHLLPPILPHKHGILALTCSIDYKHAAQITEGYTGSDLKVACRETAMGALRQVLNHLEAGGNGSTRSSKPCKLRPVVTHDLEEALKRTKPTTLSQLSRYHAWENELGSL